MYSVRKVIYKVDSSTASSKLPISSLPTEREEGLVEVDWAVCPEVVQLEIQMAVPELDVWHQPVEVGEVVATAEDDHASAGVPHQPSVEEELKVPVNLTYCDSVLQRRPWLASVYAWPDPEPL